MKIGPLHLGTYPIRSGFEFGVGAWRANGEASVTLKLLVVGLEAEWGVPDDRRRCCELTQDDWTRAYELTGGFIARLSRVDRTTVEVVTQDPDHGHVHHYVQSSEARFLGDILHRQAAAAEQHARVNAVATEVGLAPGRWDDRTCPSCGEYRLSRRSLDTVCSRCREQEGREG